ncbi:MAG: hypothetical protein C0483_19345 [Pirellula sp.]|nr:hypothetical protein [Pirellula sp.]
MVCLASFLRRCALFAVANAALAFVTCNHAQSVAAERDAAPAIPPLPEPVASFGATVADDWLYVYSGHIGKAHAHSKKNLSQKFQRVRLNSAGEWESLPAGPGLQSVALVHYGNNIYRVGGLSALNEPGEEEQLVSVADFQRYDPRAKKWTALQPLPEGRSSHDAVVVDGKLYVLGGWNLGKEETWHKHGLVLDLTKADAQWAQLPEQPFQRRALGVAVTGDRIYAVGGMNSDGEPSTDVHYFDWKKQTWAQGPNLPGKDMAGFGTSAVGIDGKLFATTFDGNVYQLSDDGAAWNSVGKLQVPRFMHRILPGVGRSLVVVGGASHKKGHLDSIESFPLVADRP